MAEPETDSILLTIKKLLGFEADYTVFDTDIMIHINTVFSTLYQIGASPPEGFFVDTAETTWAEFLGDRMSAQMVKSYVYLKVRILFDPPTSSFGLDAMQKAATEYEYRLHMMELQFNPDAFTVKPILVIE